MWFDIQKYFSEKLVDEKHRRYPLKDVLKNGCSENIYNEL